MFLAAKFVCYVLHTYMTKMFTRCAYSRLWTAIFRNESCAPQKSHRFYKSFALTGAKFWNDLPTNFYNIALAKRAFWLANMLDPFARGLHAHVSLFISTFSRQFSSSMFLKHDSFFSTPKIWKDLLILPDMRKIIPVSYEISSSSFLTGLHLRDLLI